MASINLSGILRDPLGEVSYGNKIRFTHNTTTGETVKGFRSIEPIVVNGEYDIDLEYGNVHVETWDKLNDYWVSHGVITINSDTPATSIPALLGITTPATDEDLLVFQALVADAELARDEAVSAKDETEDLFDNFDSSVSESLSLIGSDVAFEATFNDSLSVSKGYGAHDTITVASETIELPTKSIDFTCASERTVINKSGVLEAVDIDGVAIGEDGGWFHEAYSNLIPYSMFDGGYPIASSTEWIASDTVSGIDFRGINSSALKDISISANSSVSFCVYMFVGNMLESDFQRVRLSIRGSSELFINVDVYGDGSISTSSVPTGVNFEVVDIGNDVFEVCIFYDASQDNFGNNTVRFVVYPLNAASGVSFYSGFQLTEGVTSRLPHIETQSTSLAVAKTIAKNAVMGNLPSAGKAFSIKLDTTFSGNGYAFDIPTNETDAKISLRNIGGMIAFNFDKSDGTDAVIEFANDGLRHTYVASFDGINIHLYVDGNLESSLDLGGDYCTINYNEKIAIGMDIESDNQLNGEIKNLCIHHGTVSGDTVKSWGGAL